MPYLELIKRKKNRQLNKIARALLKVSYNAEFNCTFNTKAISKNLLEKFNHFKGNKYIYAIFITSSIDTDQVIRAFNKAKDNRINNRAYPRLNRTSSNCLYVGSSTTNLHTRLKEHLGYGTAKTYALQLIHWASHLDMGVEINIWHFDPSTSQEVLQALEDGLHEYYKPMFGRKGAK